jgi:hypothetical protein
MAADEKSVIEGWAAVVSSLLAEVLLLSRHDEKIVCTELVGLNFRT